MSKLTQNGNGTWSRVPLTDDEIKVQIKAQVTKYKNYLSSTDHKTFSDYKPKDGEDIQSILTERDKAREFIRANS